MPWEAARAMVLSMIMRTLGGTGIRVSSLCFGTMSFGGDADEKTAAILFARCRAAGINFFDCANVYSGGRAEEILGRLVRGERDSLVITSKVYGAMGDDPNAQGLSRRHITQAVEASLRRLGTDRIDVYFAHQFDSATPMEETLSALDDLVHSGKILHAGVSNWSAWQTMRALGKCERNGWRPPACLQPMYNVVKRQAEVEILPMAASEGLGVIPYSPLGGGLLTGKYGIGRRPDSGRLVNVPMYTRRYRNEEYYDIADRFCRHAEDRGVPPATLAVAWVMGHPAVTAPIIGARNPGQLEASLAAVDVPMTPAWRAEISALSPSPPPATDRSENQD